ncbi:MAG: DUF721 domain-containing protein [Dethiobacteria bacterium]|jgi:hypothetical protein
MEQIGPSIEHFLGKVGLKKQLNSRRFISYWPKIVGKQIVNYTRPLTIKERILWVEVTDSTWLYHLTMIKFRIIADFNAVVGQDLIKDIKFINADFRAKKPSQTGAGGSQVKESKLGEDKVTFLMAEKDKKKLDKALQHSPPFFQESLKKIFQTCYDRQRLKEKSGAKVCMNCKDYVWDYELKEGLCPCCYPIIEGWLGPLKVLYHREPWLCFSEVVSLYPSLDYNIYLLCKKKILAQYARRLSRMMERTDLDNNLRRKILGRLAQRYVMLVEEKNPEEIESELVFRTLKPFPGLYQYLYEDYIFT